LAKLERFDWEIKERIRIAGRYAELLSDSGIPGKQSLKDLKISPVAVRPDRSSVYAQYTLICEDRELFQATLKSAGIPTAVHYPVPLNEQPAYKHLCCPDCTPIASRLAKQVMSLPMSADITEAEQKSVCRALFNL
jgi:UDP-2-acetamido-2-deoxy-ribo-hexuluronate aminotransferase